MFLSRAILIILGLATIWLAPHPPMVDLPQHAGQVALLNDLLHHTSHWSDLVWINFLTPYLTAYLFSLLLIQIFPVVVAFKILLSFAYVCFIMMCMLLRREYRADERLDIYSYVVFFGFAYYWGFVTFLIAAPIALLFILLSKRLTDRPNLSLGVSVYLVGMLLLFSHGLAFVFALATGTALSGWGWLKQRISVAYMLPFFALSLSMIIIFLFVWREADPAQAARTDFSNHFSLRHDQIWLMLKVFTGDDRFWRIINLSYLFCFAVFAIAPFAMDLKISATVERLIPFAITSAILLFVPSWVLGTDFVYQRFAMFLAPSYAWMFVKHSKRDLSDASRRLSTVAFAALVAASYWTLGSHAIQSWRFRNETAGFDSELKRLEEGQRALMLIFDRSSEGASSAFAYLHYPVWYQAERKGFVDFNFAWGMQLLVRFIREQTPAVHIGDEMRPEKFDWLRHHGDAYKYFFVRGKAPDTLFASAPCSPRAIWKDDEWTIYDRQICAPSR